MSPKGLYFDRSKSALSNPRPNLIYVEGPDDAYFMDSLLAEAGASEDDVRISIIGGKDNSINSLTELVKSSAYVRKIIKKVLIVIDADKDPSATMNYLQSISTKIGLPNPVLRNFVRYEDDREFGVYLLPDCKSPGDLEELLISSVLEERRFEISKQAIDSAVAEYGAFDRESKRIAQIYMALHPGDCRGVGRAFALGAFGRGGGVDELKRFLMEFIAPH